MKYIEKIKHQYRLLCNSRLVLKHETDFEALEFFEVALNETNPATKEENDIKMLVRKLYLNDKVAFQKCIEKDPFYILMTEARSIVFHFGIQYLIYIKWNQKYSISLFNKCLMPTARSSASPMNTPNRHCSWASPTHMSIRRRSPGV